MKKLLLILSLMTASMAYAEGEYVVYKPATDMSQIKTVTENQYQAGGQKPQGYMICGKYNGTLYALSIEEFVYPITYRDKTIKNQVTKAIEAEETNGGITLADKEDNNYREFFVGKLTTSGTNDYYLWTLDESDGKVKYLTTDANYSIFLETKAQADANGHAYKLNPNVTGTSTTGGDGKGVIKRAIDVQQSALALGGQTISLYVDDTNQFFYAFNGNTGASSRNVNACLYVSEKGITTGVEKVAVDNENQPVEYYSLLGVRVENPSHGVYIMRKGNVTKKVIMK